MDGSGLERRAESANLVPHVSSRVTNIGSDHQVRIAVFETRARRFVPILRVR
jgi:hypothetical protein